MFDDYEVKVKEDAYRRAEELAALLDIDGPAALGLLLYIWRWVLTLKPNGPPDGIVRGRAACLRLEAAARWKGKRGALVQALVELGLVVRESKKLRVKGTKPYADEYRRKDKARARERDRRRAKKAAEKSAAPAKPHLVPVDGGKKLAAPLACFAAMVLLRQERYGVTPEMAPPANFEEWYAQLRAEGLIEQNILDGWALFLDDGHFATRNWPIAVFMTEKVYRTRITQSVRARVTKPMKSWSRETSHGGIFAFALAALASRGASYAASQLERLVPVSWDGETLVVEAEDRFFSAWIDEHYAGLMTDVLRLKQPGAKFECRVAGQQKSA